MRADLSTIQQTLTPEAAAALARAMDEAGRRRHGQTTPLHVAAALLPRRRGCSGRPARGRRRRRGGWGWWRGGGGGAGRTRCTAARSSSASPSRWIGSGCCGGGCRGAWGGASPPVSNALVAALKRAQAQQRRGCPEAAQQPLLAVKVELEQLVLSILDDPSVSRVMREASFSSAAVKSIIEQSLSAPSPCPSAAASTTTTGPGPLSPSPSPLRAPARQRYLNPRLAAAAAVASGGAAAVATCAQGDRRHAQADAPQPGARRRRRPGRGAQGGNPEDPDGRLPGPRRREGSSSGGGARQARRRQGGDGGEDRGPGRGGREAPRRARRRGPDLGDLKWLVDGPRRQRRKGARPRWRRWGAFSVDSGAPACGPSARRRAPPTSAARSTTRGWRRSGTSTPCPSPAAARADRRRRRRRLSSPVRPSLSPA